MEEKGTFLKAKYYQALGQNAAMQEHPSQGLTPWESFLWGLPFHLPSSQQVEGPQPPSTTPLPHPPVHLATVIFEEWDKGKATPFKMQTGWAVKGGRSQGLRFQGQRRKGQCLGSGCACLQGRDSWETAHTFLKLGFGTEKSPKVLRFTYLLGTSFALSLEAPSLISEGDRSHCLPSLGKVPGKPAALSSQAFEMTGSQDI